MLRRPPTTIKLTPEDVLEHEDLLKHNQPELSLALALATYKRPNPKTRLERIGV